MGPLASTVPTLIQAATVGTELSYFASQSNCEGLVCFQRDDIQTGESCCKEAIEPHAGFLYESLDVLTASAAGAVFSETGFQL